MTFEYDTQSVCARHISFELDGDVVRNVVFKGGCHGNLQGIGRLVEGCTVDFIEERCSGILCGRKPTSCPDQLARAVRTAYQTQQETA